MANGVVFFSYSRADSDFALKLAKDLRRAGVNLWIDQLDIKAGSHWDASVEKALDSSDSQIVILSPESIASNNVMDEVSYALECNKKVIPILLKDCTPPFRLRRLQRINFTGDYTTGLNQLLESLAHPAIENQEESKIVPPVKPMPVIEAIIEPFVEAQQPIEKIKETTHIIEKSKTGLPANKNDQPVVRSSFHPQRLISLLLALAILGCMFLPWWVVSAFNHSLMALTTAGTAISLWTAILAVIIVSFIGNKKEPYAGKTKTIAILAFVIIMVAIIRDIIFVMPAELTDIGIKGSAGIGAWLAIFFAAAGLLLVTGMLGKIMFPSSNRFIAKK